MSHVRRSRAYLSVLLLSAWLTNAIAEDFSGELPRIPATEPADAIDTFSVAPGFHMELVASEPLIGTPVAIEWDARGRMYVCEMRGYSEDREEKLSRVSLLLDEDDDGRFDSSTVFADGLLWPTAIFPFDDGLFVADAPNIYYFKDTDGDGRADVQRLALSGLGTSNVQGLVNSFRWGLDNRIHVACSSAGGEVQRAGAAADEKPVNVRGRDIAFDPVTFEFTTTSGAAQHGMCFDDWGRKFVSSNSNHIQQVMYEDRYVARNRYLSAPSSRISIAADGPQAEVFRASPVEPWRIVRTRLRVAGSVRGPIEGGGRAAGYFTGATGVTIYRGDAWPDDSKGLAIVGDVGSNLVHRKRLRGNGLEFIAERIDEKSEFVVSTDIWFRPAQFANAPDGTLHVIDVCREVIEHPKSLPPDIKKHLDLTSGRDRGRIYRIAPDGFQYRATPNLKEAATDDLVRLLAHPNAWHRETAARLLFQRQDRAAIETVKRLAQQSSSPLGRMHALYVLDGLDGLDATTLRMRLKDEHPQVRRHAIRLAEKLDDSSALTSDLVAMARDDSLDVRYQLGFTLGSIECADRASVLAKLIRRDVDDRWMRAAVQSSLADDAGSVFELLIRDDNFRSPAAGLFLQNLSSQIAQQNRREDVELAVGSLRSLSAVDAAFALPVIGKMLQGRTRSGSTLAKMSDAGDLAPLDALVKKMITASIEMAGDTQLEVADRVRVIDSLSFGKLSDVKPILKELIDSSQPHDIQRAATGTLGRYNDPAVAELLLEAWSGLSPTLRASTTEVLFARPQRTLALFDAVDAGTIPIGDLSAVRLKVASKSKDATLRGRAAKYLEAVALGRRQDVVAAYRDALTVPGDIERGRAVFKKHCAACHRVEGVGHEIGPNLAAIKTRGAETILVNVLDPSREVNPEFLNYVVLTHDGRTLTGMIVAENANSITLRRAEKESDTVLRADIDQLQSTGLSIMPEGVESMIDQQAMADLIAYLMQAR